MFSVSAFLGEFSVSQRRIGKSQAKRRICFCGNKEKQFNDFVFYDSKYNYISILIVILINNNNNNQ